MATSMLGAQIPIQCQLCNIGTEIKVKCLDCELLLCTNCEKNIHPKFKNAKDHRVISVQNLGHHSSESSDFRGKDIKEPDKHYEEIAISKKFSAKKSDPKKDIKTELSIHSEYQTTFGKVDTIAALGDCIWIRWYQVRRSEIGLQKVKLDRNELKVISSFIGPVVQICMTPMHDLLVIMNRDSTIKIIRQNENEMKDSVYKVDGVTPFSVHVTRDFKVIVGCSENIYNANGVIIVMDKDGKHLAKYNRGIYSPWRLTSTSNENIFVLHRVTNRVDVLKKGNIVNTYTGDPTLKSKRAFHPSDVTTTPIDNVVVSDLFTDTLHILNNTGCLLQTINTEGMGIEKPLSLAITSDGRCNFLYIGCSEYGKKDKANKLYKLIFSGF